MNETLNPQQAPARAELLLAAGFGQEARGRPIYGRLESENDGDGEPGPRVKIGAVRTRGAPVIARADVPDACGWRVYRAAPNGAVIFDGWIEHDPANAERVVAELHAAAAASPEAALRRAARRQPSHASAEAIARWLAGRAVEQPAVPARPRSRAARRRWRRALARKGGRR